jgi:hypothetical protein
MGRHGRVPPRYPLTAFSRARVHIALEETELLLD